MKENKKGYALSGLGEAKAREIIKNYLQKALQRSGGQKINETVSVWFSYEEFIDFAKILMDERREGIRRASQQPGVDIKIPDGVRVYFANYGNTGIAHNPRYIDQNTVVLVSTYTDPKDKTKHKDYFVPYHQLPTKATGSKPTDPFNRGALCPPSTDCDCDDVLIGDLC